MANSIRIKRTTTSGLLPNVSNSSNTSYIAAGELAINLTDRKLLSSNGSATFEIGANLATIVVGTAFTQTSGNANFDSGVLFVDGTNNRVGVNNTTPAHALSITGTLFAGNTTINGDLAIGGVDAGPNFISFRGTTGDSPNSYNHTYIGERIHTASEASELFLFKGNDPLSSAGPDRVRIGAAEFRVDTYTSELSGTFETSSNTSYIAAGELAINLTDRKLLSSNGSATFEIGANLASIVVGTAYTQTSGNANFDSGVLFVDGTNNRVGVNNTTPGHALSVTGTLAAGNTTVTGFANVSGIVSADYYTSSNNGNGTNYRVGDDAWLGDINTADTVGLKGQQNTSYGYIKFGAAPTSLGYNGTSLIYSSNVSFGNTSVTGFINVSSTAQFASTVTLANDQRLVFTANSTNPTHASKLVHRPDDVFVFYSSSTTGTERVIWSTSSNSNTSAFAVSTAITATGDITAFFSDDRLKDRYSNIPNAVEKVKSLNGFYYEPNITAQDLGYQKEMHVGVSAQEVNAIMPEIVVPAPIDNKYMTVKYDKLIPLLIEAIKEQQIQIDELKAQLNKD